jgi:hypothetical protein
MKSEVASGVAEAIFFSYGPFIRVIQMPTIGNALKIEIERYAQSLDHSSALIAATRKGMLTPQHVSAYVNGLRFLIPGALEVVRRAQRRAIARGDGALAAHYGHKLREEVGHDRWAEQDLEKLPATAEYGYGTRATALGQLLTYLDDISSHDPCLLLPYMLLVEYLTVLAAPRWLRMLEINCGIPRSSITVVTNHVALDQDHAAEGIETIDLLVTSEDKRQSMLDVLRKSIAYFEKFWSEILSTAPLAA